MEEHTWYYIRPPPPPPPYLVQNHWTGPVLILSTHHYSTHLLLYVQIQSRNVYQVTSNKVVFKLQNYINVYKPIMLDFILFFTCSMVYSLHIYKSLECMAYQYQIQDVLFSFLTFSSTDVIVLIASSIRYVHRIYIYLYTCALMNKRVQYSVHCIVSSYCASTSILLCSTAIHCH